MRKNLLIATVAALALTVPAQAERGDRADRAERAQKSERAKAQGSERAERRATRKQATSERRATRQQASERRSVRQQASERRAGRQQAAERRETRQQATSERRARVQRVRQEAASERRAVRDRQVGERRVRAQQAVSERRARNLQRIDRRERNQQAVIERRAQTRQERIERRGEIDRRQPSELTVRQRLAAREGGGERFASLRRQAWEQRAERQRELSERRERFRNAARARFDDDDRDRRRRLFSVGQRVDRDWWYDDYVPVRYSSRYRDSDDFYYRYDGDYVYRLRRDDDIVLALFPIFGGAYSVGRPLPFYYSSYYNVPFGYSSLYYDTPDHYYRYGDGAIYQVDPTTQLIAGIVALLTGQTFGIGQRMPLGYDVYNVPYAYRSSYYDTDDMWYRYDDGYVYGIDPRTRIVQSSYPIYSGYAVGNPWPTYAGYDYSVPGYYDDLYYSDPRYDYRYASGGIYAVDPTTQLVAALAALVTGQNFGVGQRLPFGYDVYNVPFAYRDRYYDDDRNWYRYADGRIYQVDPGTRLIRRVIIV